MAGAATSRSDVQIVTTIARLCSVYLSLVGLVIAAHFIAVPIYHPGGDDPYPIRDVLNYFAGTAVLIALLVSGSVKWSEEAGDGSDAVSFITANVVFYSVLVLGILFFWNWRGGDDYLIRNFTDVGLPLALVAAGRQLWCAGSNRGLSAGVRIRPPTRPRLPDGIGVLQGVLGCYALIVAAFVAGKFIGGASWPGWTELNYFMAGGVLIALGSAVAWKRRDGSGGGSGNRVRRFLDANVPLQAAAALFLAFCFQWFATTSDHIQVLAMIDGRESNVASLWAYIDTAYIVISGVVGLRLLRGATRP